MHAGVKLAVAAAVALLCLRGKAAVSIQEDDRALADSLDATLRAIREGSEADRSEAVEFEIGEKEANAYLRCRLVGRLPEGVEAPWVRFADGFVEAGATLDLTLLGDRAPSSSVFRLLSGRVPVETKADVVAENGVGKLTIERFTVGGLGLPTFLLQDMVTSYTKSPSRPEGIRLEEPFALPFRISSARILEGRVVLLQGG